jgi:hypothetical protein
MTVVGTFSVASDKACATHMSYRDVNTQACSQSGVGSRISYMVTFVDSNVGSLNATTGVAKFLLPGGGGIGYVCLGEMAVRRATCKICGAQKLVIISRVRNKEQ